LFFDVKLYDLKHSMPIADEEEQGNPSEECHVSRKAAFENY